MWNCDWEYQHQDILKRNYDRQISGQCKPVSPVRKVICEGCGCVFYTYERTSKHPKSTKYGRQNPISARWNSEEQLVFWREAWADAVNQSLECNNIEERIDHRSHAARGLDEQPTIHEGVTARALKRRGIVSDRCELNRQIKADNALLQELKSLVKKLMVAAKNTIPTIAEAMETVRQKMIIFRYRLLHIKSGKTQIANALKVVRPDLKRYEDIVKQLKTKIRERQTQLEEKKAIPAIKVFRHRELAQRIAALTENIEELKSEKALLLNQLDYVGDHSMTEVKQRVASMESSLKKLDQQEIEYIAELDSALAEYTELQQQVADMDTVELNAARQAIRPDRERDTVQQIQDTYGKKFDSSLLTESRKDVAGLLGETSEPVSIHQKLQQSSEYLDKQYHRKGHDREEER